MLISTLSPYFKIRTDVLLINYRYNIFKIYDLLFYICDLISITQKTTNYDNDHIHIEC